MDLREEALAARPPNAGKGRARSPGNKIIYGCLGRSRGLPRTLSRAGKDFGARGSWVQRSGVSPSVFAGSSWTFAVSFPVSDIEGRAFLISPRWEVGGSGRIGGRGISCRLAPRSLRPSTGNSRPSPTRGAGHQYCGGTAEGGNTNNQTETGRNMDISWCPTARSARRAKAWYVRAVFDGVLRRRCPGRPR